MQVQLQVMLDLQEVINTQVHPQWRAQQYPWYRAIWTECAELMDHHGWKWWKQQQPDAAQVALELIDIWHFGLSHCLQIKTSPEVLQTALECGMDRSTGGDFLTAVEAFAGSSLTSRGFDVEAFGALLNSAELSFEQLYRSYVGKNVLNRFRQDHGYQSGNYQKLWQGREDNEHLLEAMAGLDSDARDFQDALYNALRARYRALTQ